MPATAKTNVGLASRGT